MFIIRNNTQKEREERGRVGKGEIEEEDYNKFNVEIKHEMEGGGVVHRKLAIYALLP